MQISFCFCKTCICLNNLENIQISVNMIDRLDITDEYLVKCDFVLEYSYFYGCSIKYFTGRGSSIRSESAWHASGPEFDPHVRHIHSWRVGHENISTAILPLPLIQEEQLSVTDERMCTKYW